MALRGSRTVALLVAITVSACAAVANIDTSDPEKLPERGEPADASDGSANGDASGRDAAPAVDAAPKPGGWLQANGQDCVTFCSKRGMTNVPSPEGAKCTSGENIPQSAIAAGITYDECFPSCSAHLAGPDASSSGEDCYATGQNEDGDPSDVTRGCFCR